MSSGTGRGASEKTARVASVARALAFVVIAVSTIIATPRQAQALPSFARQTGQACGACHTDYPQLTPFGRRFKLGGYTLGGGRSAPEYKKTFGDDSWMPPISVMGIGTFTNTQAGQPGGGPGTTIENNYVNLQQGSIFYGGAITDELGAFVQATITDHNQVSSTQTSAVTWDNLDVRYAKTGTFFGADAIYGVTLHNNPTVQDVWNTTPAWGFPFVASGFAPGPAAATMIEGNFAGKVLGLGAYTFINDIFYFEVTGYRGLPQKSQNMFGVWDYAALNSKMDGVSPYARVAVEPHWGDHWLEVGAFALRAAVDPFYVDNLNPGIANGSYTPIFTMPGTDKYLDLGVDAQYQYMGAKNSVLTLRASYIKEKQTLDATFANGLSDNPTNTLNSFKAQASYAWNTDALTDKWVFTGGYFNTQGSTDVKLYANLNPISGNQTGVPNSDGWIAEIAYFPFAMGRPDLWPWANARVGLQHIWYNKFNGASTNYDGNGRDARDNNTTFLYVWFAM